MSNRQEKSQVAIVECSSYDEQEVQDAIERGIQLLGGIDKFISQQDQVLLNPNLLSKHVPEDCVTTHPAVFKAVAKKISNFSSKKVLYGDSPSQGNPKKVAEKAGLIEVGEELDLSYVDFEEGQEIFIDNDNRSRKYKIATPVLEADTVINLPKLKNHNLTRITGAVKNTFGCVPGFNKPELHLKLPEADRFSKMLVELQKFINPSLHIMDGVMGMEGEGPNSGDPIPVNILLFSSDPVALDTVFSKIINLDPKKVDTNRYGKKAGLGFLEDSRIELIGDDIADFIIEDFEVYRGIETAQHPLLKYNFLKSFFSRKPVINAETCIACGACIEQCPTDPKSLFRQQKNSIPKYDYDRCIRCFCCHEICPEKAISIQEPLLRKLVDWYYKIT